MNYQDYLEELRSYKLARKNPEADPAFKAKQHAPEVPMMGCVLLDLSELRRVHETRK